MPCHKLHIEKVGYNVYLLNVLSILQQFCIQIRSQGLDILIGRRTQSWMLWFFPLWMLSFYLACKVTAKMLELWKIFTTTGKSLSEALIFASTYPHSKLRPGENMLCTEIASDIQNSFCTQHVLPMFYKKKSYWQRFTCQKVLFRLVWPQLWNLKVIYFTPLP